jgi:outer membrane lipoprotein-sorting protein
MQFSAYQAVNGVLVPFSVSEFVAGQQTMAIQLSHVTFNSGLTDSVFE